MHKLINKSVFYLCITIIFHDLMSNPLQKNKLESFGLQWLGKSYAKAIAVSPLQTALTPEKNFNLLSSKPEKIKNVLIKGDNLEVLKHLQEEFQEKVQMIYIDPPYNTGGENFLYSDRKFLTVENIESIENVNQEEIQQFLKSLDRKDSSHSAWLNFMYPRLFLSRKLLKKTGVIFVSIDDRELAYLRILMDEIFGEENFVGIFKWNKTSTPPSLSNKIRQKYEYVLCYEKEKNNQVYFGGKVKGGDMPLLNEGNSIKDLVFPPFSVTFKMKGKYPPGKYNNVELLTALDIKKEGKYPHSFRMKGAFKWSQKYLNDQISLGTQLIIKSNKFSIRYKKQGDRIKKPDDIISKSQCGVGTNADAKKELAQLFGKKNIFDYPKPVSLLKYLINFTVNKDKEDIILDFFAGSGTTGEAVMQLNHEDGGNRRFILVQSDEKIDSKNSKEAYDFIKYTLKKENPDIFDITEERLLRAAKKWDKKTHGKKYAFIKYEAVKILKER